MDNPRCNSENTFLIDFSGKFEDESLENILSALQFGHNFEYEIDGKEIKLIFN